MKQRYSEPPPPEADLEEFRKVVEGRRSVRKFRDEPIPSEVIDDCLHLSMLAANSSNLQPWQFYVVEDPDTRQQLAAACLGQSAATTAPVLIPVVARLDTWRGISRRVLKEWPGKPPQIVERYYRYFTTIQYEQGPLDILGRIKSRASAIASLAWPMMQHPISRDDMKVWAAKSCSLAAAHLMLALRAHGYDSCPMEGFDERRVRRILKLPRNSFTVMIVSAGRRADNGIYHPRVRMPDEDFIVRI